MARDGWWFAGPALLVILFGLALIASGIAWGWPIAAVGLVAAGAFAYFFRDPHRTPPDDPEAVIATADGRVLSVLEGPDGALQIDTFLSVLDVHVNRAPVSGMVTESAYRPGRFHLAYAPAAGEANERHDLAIESPIGLVRSAQIAGVLARRIVCRASQGDCLQVGERIGMIKFGSRAQVILPPGFTACVREGQRVRAGESIVARRIEPVTHA
jgi:phosphatidylserine decarboxylase